jgi:hypothetical protein
LEGKSGSILEKFDGKESLITFLPYDIFQNKRILLLIQSCNSDGGNESNKCIGNNKEINLFNENILTRLSSFLGNFLFLFLFYYSILNSLLVSLLG